MTPPDPTYSRIPEAEDASQLFQVPIAALHPTQWCIGLAEIWSRQQDFAKEDQQEHLDYLRRKPVPLVRGGDGTLWMVDRHHRLRALLGLNSGATTWGYLIEELPDSSATTSEVSEPSCSTDRWARQWPASGKELPTSLMDLDDDPYARLSGSSKRRG